MSSVGHPDIAPIKERLKLDATSFQKLLAAAWAIQRQHDAAREAELPAKAPRIAIPDGFFEPAESRFLEALGSREVPSESPVPVGTPTKLPPQSVHTVTETAGALALASDRRAIETGIARGKRATGALRLVVNQQRNSPVYTIEKRNFRLAIILGAALVLFAALGAMWGYRIATRHSESSHAVASTSAVQKGEVRQNKSLVESSHLRLTDSETAAALEQLSRYEIRPLQRQAMFGDNGAALLLGMAYEVGSGVHQNCSEAARWIRLAAEDGNAAAQYNLGLRYLYGDGVPADRNASTKWLKGAATLGYEKAQKALRDLKQ